jgi:hypothetical protein
MIGLSTRELISTTVCATLAGAPSSQAASQFELGRPRCHDKRRMRAELPVKRPDRQWDRELPGGCLPCRAERRGDAHGHGRPVPRHGDGVAVGSFRRWNMAKPGAEWDLYGHVESGAKMNSVRRHYWLVRANVARRLAGRFVAFQSLGTRPAIPPFTFGAWR